MTNSQRFILYLTVVFISFLYYLSSAYINCSNDGSHYALVSAMVNERSTEVSKYLNYTAGIDYAVKDGKNYSDRLPGNAILMIPFYLYGKIVSAMGFHSAIDWRPIEEVTVVLEANLCGALGVLFLCLIFLHFGFSFQLSLCSSIIYGISTLNWQESTHVFSHAASMCFVLIAIYCFLKTKALSDKLFMIGLFFLSYSVAIELQNILYYLPVFIYLVSSRLLQINKLNQNTLMYLKLVFVGLIGVLIVLLYNYFTFHEWTLKSNKYNPMFPEEVSFLSSLSGKPLKGLDILFTNFRNSQVYFDWSIATQNETPGLFVVSPLLLLAIPGYFLFYKRSRKEALLFLSIIGINVLIAALHKTVLVRHIFTITPLVFFPIIYVIQYCLSYSVRWIRIVCMSGIVLLVLTSMTRVFYIIHTYYGRRLDDLFPFRKEIIVYAIFIVLISVISAIFIIGKRSFKKSYEI